MQPVKINLNYAPTFPFNTTLLCDTDTSQNAALSQGSASEQPMIHDSDLASIITRNIAPETDTQEATPLLNTPAPMQTFKLSTTTQDQLLPFRSSLGYSNVPLSMSKRKKKRPQSLAIVSHHSCEDPSIIISPPNQDSGSEFEPDCKAELEQASEQEQDKGSPFDPQIDTFEILRAKITGITRTMQEFQVHELFHEEPLLTRNHQRYHTEPDHSVVSPPLLSPQGLDIQEEDPFPRRRRIYSHYGSIPVTPYSENSCFALSEETRVPTPEAWDTTVENPWAHLCTNEDFERDMASYYSRPTSPRIATLFTTTNKLIQSRLSEEASSVTLGEVVTPIAAQWRSQFLNLATACIHHSEHLEGLSTELLSSEGRVRKLLSLETMVNEQFEEREKAYDGRIRECQSVAKQQKIMIESLEELMADLEMKIRQLNRRHEPEHCTKESETGRWSFQRPVSKIVSLEEKDDLIHKLRWDVGMLIGGGVGTGHVIHTFEGRLSGIEMIISGSGTTMESGEIEQSYFVSRSLQQAKFHLHHFTLHILPEDRKTRFYLLSKEEWVSDYLVDQCQFKHATLARQCSNRFTFFQRRHHCRRCGKIICQRHSTNRLPLFPPSSAHHQRQIQWHRVCDRCFLDLITPFEEA